MSTAFQVCTIERDTIRVSLDGGGSKPYARVRSVTAKALANWSESWGFEQVDQFQLLANYAFLAYLPGEWGSTSRLRAPGVWVHVFLCRRILTMPAGPLTQLGTKKIDGQCAVGFGFDSERPHGLRTDIFWISPETRLPVRIEVWLFAEDGETVRQKFVLSDFVNDEPLDLALFDTTPPAGYIVKEDVISGSVED
jgi:hypothetical protein